MTPRFFLILCVLCGAPARSARAASSEDALLAELHVEDPAVREHACAELAQLPKRSSVVFPALAAAMDRDLSDRVRLAAAKALITYPGDESLRHAQSFLQSEPGAQNRIGLTLALSTEPAHVGEGDATDLIIGMLTDDPSSDERLAAVQALTVRGDIRALRSLRVAAQGDADKRVREAARKAAAVLAVPRPVPPKPAARKPQAPKDNAVKGVDSCPAPWGWCECDGPIKRPPKCLTRPDCRIEVDTVIQLGMPCLWNNMSIGEPDS